MKYLVLVATILLAGATQLSCTINDYCLGCARDDGGAGDGGGSNIDGGDPTADANDGGPCVPSGPETCNGLDDDCNGFTDDGNLPGVGDSCSNQVGECAGGTQQCTAGMLRCSKSATPEVCDMKDNNCNGTVDEGDPGGGAKCGTDVGECVAGTYRCDQATGTIVCIGSVGTVGGDPEVCDAKDNDCDGNFDEGIGSFGSCGPATSEGECNIGSLMCQAGTPVCMGAVFPVFETCNAKDDDCDTKTDEDFDTTTDPNHCGVCGMSCPTPANANRRCLNSACGYVCKAGYKDLDGMASNGCEFGPCFETGAEECDGADNDCDAKVDEALNAPAICASGGECGAATATCNGASGWSCNYPSTVQFPETRCDSLDNDCDSRVDEGQPNVGQACNDGGVGICRGTGSYQCDSNNLDGPAVCTITSPGMSPTTETCDGIDQDCDSIVDEGAPDTMVEVRNSSNVLLFRIYAYEASRPDATASATGVMSHRSCSKPSAIPWSSVTYDQAAAACAAAGARLCTASEWRQACAGNSNLAYPYGNTYQPNTCNGNDYDPDCTAPDNDRALPTGAAHGCPTKPAQSGCASAFGAYDMSGNLKEWTSTAAGTDAFEVRGGGYDSPSGGLGCSFDFVSMNRTFAFSNLGFRCCSNP